MVPALAFSGILTLASCGSDDSTPDITPTVTAQGHYFLGVKADDGTEFVMQAPSLENGDLNIKDNILELPQTEYTWIFKGPLAVGFVYQQQFAGLGYAMRYTVADAPFSKIGEFQISTRYSTFGFFDGQILTSVAGQLSTDGSRNDGATFAFWNVSDGGVSLDHTKTIWTENLTNTDGQQTTFCGIVDNGDGTFFTALVQSSFHQTGTGNGSSVGDVLYPDSCWVAKMDKDLNVIKIYGDDRISYAAGNYRSQVFQEIFKADDGTLYVFSNAFNAATSHKAGAIRLLPGADTFDPNYLFDLQTPAGGLKPRRIWHIGDDRFLIEYYNVENPTTITAGHVYAIADMGERRLTMVSGLPAKNNIISGAETGGVPLSRDGKIYLPITTFGADAAIYVIDPVTAVAAKGITLKGVREIRSIGYME